MAEVMGALSLAAGTMKPTVDLVRTIGNSLPDAVAICKSLLPGIKSDSSEEEHNVLAYGLHVLKSSIDNLKCDLEALARSQDWHSIQFRYCGHIDSIKLAAEHACKLGIPTDNPNAVALAKRLNIDITSLSPTEIRRTLLDQGKDLQASVYAIFCGLEGLELPQLEGNNILEELCRMTSGDLSKLENLCNKLLLLLMAGVSTVALICYLKYESYGQDAVTCNMVVESYRENFEIVQRRMDEILRKCVDDSVGNIKKDLDEVLSRNNALPNGELCRTLFAVLAEKYNWLHFVCVVYDTVGGPIRQTAVPSDTVISRVVTGQQHEREVLVIWREKEEDPGKELEESGRKSQAIDTLHAGLRTWNMVDRLDELRDHFVAAFHRNNINIWGLFIYNITNNLALVNDPYGKCVVLNVTDYESFKGGVSVLCK